MGLSASLDLVFHPWQYVLIQLRWKTGAAPRIQAHLRRLGYEIGEKWRLRPGYAGLRSGTIEPEAVDRLERR
ncbi:hypothetical protein MAMT_01140 [Methylacidimicrobium tartarophylax]|uniref:Uncharacterized protein n=1 Tax=Methylacidimicrobium tartarophylax TaxID=1041768 RepID=A0A5E6MAA5_9BACT|nr:hypothetical protein MAMT_01140 [Methylacidimicrobium tartarophylax]